jgi:hypothetical protein
MSWWEHRILLSPDGRTYSLYDVYANDQNVLDSWSQFPSVFVGDTKEGVIDLLEKALARAKSLPVLKMPKTDKDKLEEAE